MVARATNHNEATSRCEQLLELGIDEGDDAPFPFLLSSIGERAGARGRAGAIRDALCQRCAVFWFGMPSIGHSSAPTVGRVIASTISRVPSGSLIQFL